MSGGGFATLEEVRAYSTTGRAQPTAQAHSNRSHQDNTRARDYSGARNFLLLLAFSGGLVCAAESTKASAPHDANPADADGQTYDLVVVGATPSGIACAVRAAREGLSVLLVQHTRHIGGMLTNGLFQWDSLYAGHRAPIFENMHT